MRPYWQLYKKLEGLPEATPEPVAEPELTLPLRQAWKLLIDLLTQELVYEQQIEFLERCLKHDLMNSNKSSNFWVKFGKLLD
ncbi:hypothetical protein [Chroococcus sp. FPU101]|uniref:hypothetical protein n=1 Tax=Chroococcus sp. FPU101 TaxID=1974212 RepID=UPI001A8F58B1|nr:hypothetical protein [Chroococcus sp. FPU101]GFE69758.1 hypothetical protein CFPU101_23680 [Chroococcus sp. FPU101]